MAYLVVFVLDNPDQCTRVLDAWETAGVPGVTILESTGIGRLRHGGILDDFPLMPSLGDLLRSKETHHRTLFSVVHRQAQVDALVKATESVVGDLDQDRTGLVFVIALHQVFGVRESASGEENVDG